MTHKPFLDGTKAKFIFGDMADAATAVVNNAAEGLLKQHRGDEAAVTEALAVILRDGMKLQRIINLLETGRADEAEALIMKGNAK